MSQTKVLYHKNCLDGLGAFYAAKKAFPDAVGYQVQYGDSVPTDLCLDDDVYILDFSFPRAVLEDLKGRVKSLKVIDHHKTAAADLEGLDYCVFDMAKSGAVLSWEYFHPGTPVPWLLQHIQDRDLWSWSLPCTKEILTGLRFLRQDSPDSFSEWDDVGGYLRNRLVTLGQTVSEEHFNQVASACSPDKVRELTLVVEQDRQILNVYRAALVNTTIHVSEIGNHLVSNQEFPGGEFDLAIMYFIGPDGVPVFSFRSLAGKNPKVDTSVIAKALGGGGHENASGAKHPDNMARLAKMYQFAAINKPFTVSLPATAPSEDSQ